MSKKPKTLGCIKYGKLSLVNTNMAQGEATLMVSNGDKSVKLEGSPYFWARSLVATAREIAHKQREYAEFERRRYEELAELTGYKPGEEQ